MSPGHTQLQRMPWAAYPTATHRVQSQDAVLGGGIGRKIPEPGETDDRTGIDNAAARSRPPHGDDGMFATPERALQVYCVDGMPLRVRGLMQFDVEADAGVIHHHIESAEFRLAPVDGRDDVCLHCHIPALKHGPAASLHDVVDSLAPLVLEPIDRNDGRSVFCERRGDRTPQSTRRTRYDCPLAMKTHCSFSLSKQDSRRAPADDRSEPSFYRYTHPSTSLSRAPERNSSNLARMRKLIASLIVHAEI